MICKIDVIRDKHDTLPASVSQRILDTHGRQDIVSRPSDVSCWGVGADR